MAGNSTACTGNKYFFKDTFIFTEDNHQISERFATFGDIEIYENDIVKDFNHGYCYKVIFDQGGFILYEEDLGTMECLHTYNLNDLEVIGNSFMKGE